MHILAYAKRSINLNLKKINFWIFAFCFFAFVLNIIGCATVPTYELAIPTYNIKGVDYLPLALLCDLKDIKWDYDTFTKKITLKKESRQVDLLVGSSLVLVDGIPEDLNSPVSIYEGIVLVPHKFKSRIIDVLFKPGYPKDRTPSAYITAIRKIVIDPGHGGKDPGAIGRSGLREKDVCLDIAKRLKPILETSGFEVFLTRDYDTFIPLEKRAIFANQKNVDLFISIHANANRARRLAGFEVYYVSNQVDDSRRALVSAENADLRLENSTMGNQTINLKTTVWDIIYNQNRCESIELARQICKSVSHNLNTKVLGVKGAPFYVLKWTQMPSVLVEVGFLSNDYEEKLLRDRFYRQQIAETIAQGIRNYCQDYRLTLESRR